MLRTPYLIPLALMISVGCLGCAGMTEKKRINQFAIIANAYQNAIRMSDFKNANQFLDPAVSKERRYADRLKKVTVSNYRAVKLAISADRLEIRQQAEIEYYLIDRPVLKKLIDQQRWLYKAEKDMWFLRSGLPAFDLGQ